MENKFNIVDPKDLLTILDRFSSFSTYFDQGQVPSKYTTALVAYIAYLEKRIEQLELQTSKIG